MEQYNIGGCLPSKKDLRDFKLCSANVQQEYPKEFQLENLPKVKNQGNVNSCHDEETQVLTKCGWKYFKDITYDDELASADPQTGNLIFEKPTNIIAEDYDGVMIYGHHRNLDFMVTPNHKMVVRRRINNCGNRIFYPLFEKYDADKLPHIGLLQNRFHYHNPNTAKEISINNHVFQLDLWVQLIGIYLAEGSIDTIESKRHRIQLAAVKKREREFICNLLEELNIKYSSTDDRIRFSDTDIYNKFKEYGLIGKHSYEKFIPDFIFNLDERYIKLFLYAFAMGDGCFNKDGTIVYITTSTSLKDGIELLSIMCGDNVIVTKHEPVSGGFIGKRQIIGKHEVFNIKTLLNSQNLRRCNLTEKIYTGKVYCAEVPTYHTLITKRHERILLSGNCCAHATASLLEYFDKNNHTLSTNFIYGIQHKLFNQDSPGMFIAQACRITRDYGCPLEQDCKGNDEIPVAWGIAEAASKNEEIMKKAYNYRTLSYYACNTDNDIKYALMNYGPVLGAIYWREDFYVDAQGKVIFNTRSNGGGHCVLIYGWNEKGWLIQNSWGASFANGGRFILPYGYGFMETRALIDYENPEDATLCQPKNNKVLNILYKIANFFINLFNNEN